MGGVDMQRFLQLEPVEIQNLVRQEQRSGNFHLPRDHVYLFPLPNGREVLCNMTRITYPNGSIPLGTKSADMTFAEMEGRRQARSYAAFLKERVPGFEHSYLVDTGAQVGVRQTRSIQGVARLNN
jgi:hypothetical protein